MTSLRVDRYSDSDAQWMHRKRSKAVRLLILCLIFSFTLFLYGCGEEKVPEMAAVPEQTDDIFTDREWSVIQRLSPLPEVPPPNTTNRVAG